MTIKEIVGAYLIEHGLDGLASEACCCALPDIMPCDGFFVNCEAGKKIPCNPETCTADGDCDYHIQPVSDEE